MPADDPLISVVIPVKNGEATISECLKAVQDQTYKHTEVIVLDSGSTDRTLEIASGFPFVQIVKIDPNDFNHGTTRNVGLRAGSGEFFFYTVQDAIIADNTFFERMLQRFSNPELAGICGQQIVAHDPDKNPHEWFRPVSKPSVRTVHFPDVEELEILSAEEFRRLCGWDNVVAMYRGDILRQFPFRHTSFGEDKLWAIDVIKAGHKLLFDTSFRVYHYHHPTFDYSYKRTLTVLYYTHKYFGVDRELKYSFKDYLKIIPRNFKYKAKPSWILFNWNKMKGVNKASNDFMAYLKKGEASLDKFYFQACANPPQGAQNKQIKNK